MGGIGGGGGLTTSPCGRSPRYAAKVEVRRARKRSGVGDILERPQIAKPRPRELSLVLSVEDQEFKAARPVLNDERVRPPHCLPVRIEILSIQAIQVLLAISALLFRQEEPYDAMAFEQKVAIIEGGVLDGKEPPKFSTSINSPEFQSEREEYGGIFHLQSIDRYSAHSFVNGPSSALKRSPQGQSGSNHGLRGWYGLNRPSHEKIPNSREDLRT